MLISHLSTAFLLLAASGRVLPQKVKQHGCGLPTNIESLPEYAKVELKDLWSTYIEGTPCLKELAIQQDVLNVVRTFSSEFVGKKTTAINSSGRRSIVPAATTPAGEDYEEEPLTTPFPRLIAGAEIQLKPSPEPIRFDEASIDDIATLRFNNAAKAPFLHSAAPEVRRKFEKIWNDENIPSEALRNLKIQTLAVSLLNGKQLEEYNRWATKRRYVLKAREHELRELSPAAKRTLRRISNRYRDHEEIAVAPAVKQELRNFIAAFNRRRSKLAH